MDGPRLNQLKYPDETKLGMVVLIAYMLVEAAQSFSLGGSLVLQAITGSEPGAGAVGLAQVLCMLGLAGALMFWRVRRSTRDLDLRAIHTVDATMARESEYLGRHIGSGRPQFLVTSNMGDTNAFCLSTGKSPWIVLGGGLRLLMRKRREQALAIVGHECAHVSEGDTLYVLAAWNLFNAYVLLTVGNLLLTQVGFWSRVPAVIAEYEIAGSGLLGLIQQNASYIFLGGFPGLISLVGVAVVLRHFIRAREYRADERAAQFGLRTALADALGSQSESKYGSWLQRLFRFHPAAPARIERLGDERQWARIDLLFLGAMAFLGARISEYEPGGSGTPVVAESFSDAAGQLPGLFAASPSLLFGAAIDLALAFVAIMHVYRVTAAQSRLGITLLDRIGALFAPFVVLFLGSIAGTLTSWGQIVRVSNKSVEWTLAQALDSAVVTAGVNAELTVFLMCSVVVVTAWLQRRQAGTPIARLSKLAGAVIVAAFVIQFVIGVGVVGVGSLMFGISAPRWDVAWLPASTAQPVEGMPSILQSSLIFGAILIAFKFIAHLRRKKQAAPASSRVHPTWLVEDGPIEAAVRSAGHALGQSPPAS